MALSTIIFKMKSKMIFKKLKSRMMFKKIVLNDVWND